ncbi:MAG: hypothetical protein ACKPGT_35775 [Microcystis sp.]
MTQGTARNVNRVRGEYQELRACSCSYDCRIIFYGSSGFCVISLTYIMIDLCVLCVFVVRSTHSLGVMYLRIHFTHQI